MAGSKSRRTVLSLARELASGKTSASALVDQALANIADKAGEGARAFISLNDAEARQAAEHADEERKHGHNRSPFAGIPISVKDLFDVKGEVTRAGSRILSGAKPADADAIAVKRLRKAGFILIGRTNMTEFAYSGLGINPHYGTPLNPWDRKSKRIPGGSSSGAAVSVADGMAMAGLGSDTGGSCRIPAAFCGITGFKPTASRVPLDGAFPLSSSLDSIGSLANSVSCCSIIDGIVAGEPARDLQAISLHGMHFAVPQTLVLDQLDAVVESRFEVTLSALQAAGVTIERIPFSELSQIAVMGAKGGFPAAESFAFHRTLLEQHADGYDPRVKIRIMRGKEQSAADYIELLAARKKLITQAARTTAPFDALIFPTVPMIAPKIEALAADEEFNRINLLSLRNSTVANILDRCAISLPCGAPGEAPVGITLMARNLEDDRLLRIAMAVEQLELNKH